MAPRPLALALAFAFSFSAWPQDPVDKVASALAEAPPLPFRYVGRLVQNGREEVLVMRGGLLYSLAVGDEVDGEYRVERITGAGVDFTYLPARAKQNLDLTSARR